MIQGHNKLEIRLDFYRGVDGIYQSYWVNKFMRSFYKQGKAAVIERHMYSALRIMRLLRMQKPTILHKSKIKPRFKPRTLRIIRQLQRQKSFKILAQTKQQIFKRYIARWKKFPTTTFAARFGLRAALWANWLIWLQKKPDLSLLFLDKNHWVKLKWHKALSYANKRKVALPQWLNFIKTRSKAVQSRWALFIKNHKKPRKWLIYKTWPQFVKQASNEFQEQFGAFSKKSIQPKYSGAAILLEIVESIKPVLTTRAKNRGKGRVGREYPYMLSKAKQYLMATRWLKKEVDYYWQSERSLYKRIMAIFSDSGALMKHYLIERRSDMFEAAIENRQRARWSWLGRK